VTSKILKGAGEPHSEHNANGNVSPRRKSLFYCAKQTPLDPRIQSGVEIRVIWVQEAIGYVERRLFLWLRGCLGLRWSSNSNCAMDYRQMCQTAQANSEHLI